MSRDGGPPLSEEESRRLGALGAARSLGDLVDMTGAEGEDEAYFEAKRDWFDLRGRALPPPDYEGIPGSAVTVHGVTFHVHGVTHAGTDEERGFLRDGVRRSLGEGDEVYCEQGVRRMYFDDIDGVCEMDDYTWSLGRCRSTGVDDCVADVDRSGIVENFGSVASSFRDAVFSLIESGRPVYGDGFADALGDVATAFLTDRKDASKGYDFESFRLSRRAAVRPESLGELQRYYERKTLPQPVEREWLRRIDPEIELFTHARNERMADYAVFHHDGGDVRIIVGAAHQPGVVYYLREHADGERSVDGFELSG